MRNGLSLCRWRSFGGLPAARSLLRLKVPRGILDSTQIVRATLILIPSDSIRGVPSDSFNLLVLPAAVDFGAKTSNLADPRLPPDSAIMRVGRPDTVQIEVTNILRRWQVDCYFGEDEPLGPGKFMGRPRATTFEYAYANARIAK